MARGDATIDRKLLKGARRGEQAAFRELVERYQNRLFMLALGMVKDAEEARDVVQDAFLKAVTHLDDFLGQASFYTWIYRITLNLCIDRIRKHRPAETLNYNDEIEATEEDATGLWLLAETHGDPFKECARTQLRGSIQGALSRISPEHRTVLLLREVEGLSYDEIAETLQINPGTVMSRLFHARRNFRRAMIQTCAVPPQKEEEP